MPTPPRPLRYPASPPSCAAEQAARVSRRRFVQQSSLATAGLLAVPNLVSGRDVNQKLRLAIIGCGGRGAANLAAVAGEQITALCDVNQRTLDKAAERFPQARRETDFRRLFDHASEFDAVVVSTSEHTHAFATLPALQLGKHVYCEKPLTHSVWEARVIRQAAARAQVATQMGTQIHAGDNYRRVVESIQAGAIGDVSEVHVWVSRTWGWQPDPQASERAGDIVFTRDRPASVDPVPAGLDWDLWLGPAPWRPFSNVYLPGPKWYRWWDFGNGTMSDLGSHFNDLPFWALRLDAPTAVQSFGPPPHAEIAPASMRSIYEFPAVDDRPPVKLTWYQGDEKPEIWTVGKIPQWKNGVLFVGDQGMLLADYGKHTLLPEEKFREIQPPEPSIAASIGHHAEWLEACKTGAETTCDFQYAGLLTEANHLGNVAYRVGKRLHWDSTAMRCPDAPQADRFLRREYRAGWSLDS